MQRLFLGNFDFEHHLPQGARRPAVSAAAVRRQHELAAVWHAAADDGDFVWLPAPVEPDFFDELPENGMPRVRPVVAASQIELPVQAWPWGWTDDLRRRCGKQGWTFAAPPQEVVREANSRRFSLELEREWGIGLEEAAVIRTNEEFAAALARLPSSCQQWVLKAEFGMSARERILGRGRQPTASAANWLRKRLEAGEAAVLEPWVERLEEAGLQFTVPPDGCAVLDGVLPLLCDAAGQYRGNRFARDVDTEVRWKTAIETGLRVARRLGELGYFGPLGIDAMRYRDGSGIVRIRAVQDVNARHTMGRLALGLRRLLQPGEHGAWLHAAWPTDGNDAARRHVESLAARLPAGTRLVRTSPFVVDDRPVSHGTLLLAADSQPALEIAEAIVLGL